MKTNRTALLADYLTGKFNQPFRWGTNDCMTFSIGFVERVTGRRLLPAPLWANEHEAALTVKQHGGLVAALDAHFTRLGHPNYAQDGDLAIADGVVSLVSGSHVVAPGENGLVLKPRTEADHAWTY